MASADFCTGFPPPLDGGSTEVPLGTPAVLHGYCALTFTLMSVGSMTEGNPCGTSRRSVQVSGFDDIGRLTPPCRLVSASCSSDQRFAFGFLQISSRPEHPCRSANSSPCRASRGLPPPSECALPGAPRKSPEQVRALEWWWRQGGSNSRPSDCEPDALPAELCPQTAAILQTAPERVKIGAGAGFRG